MSSAFASHWAIVRLVLGNGLLLAGLGGVVGILVALPSIVRGPCERLMERRRRIDVEDLDDQIADTDAALFCERPFP